ncbi:MAG: hypothetical protein LBI44_01310, partial [Oscillospiraceae bacterium]|nr:hypothetical protein [Oscillospiraceae bacterium]
KTVIFALIPSLLLALAACAGGSSPSPSVPADSPSPSQSTPSTPAPPSDSPSPSPSPSPSEAEPSPSIDPALSKDGKFRAQSTLTEDPRSGKQGVVNFGINRLWYGMNFFGSESIGFNVYDSDLDELKKFNEENFKEIYDMLGVELNEDILRDMIYNKYKKQYDKYMGMFTSEHKHIREIAAIWHKWDHSDRISNFPGYTLKGHLLGLTEMRILISDYICYDQDDFNVERLDNYDFLVDQFADMKRTGHEFLYINIQNARVPNVDVVSALALTRNLAQKYEITYYEDAIIILVQLDDIPYYFIFRLDENNDFYIENLNGLANAEYAWPEPAIYLK